MGKNLIIRRGGGISPAKFDAMVNEVAISQGLLAYSDLILASTFALDLDNGKSFGFDNVNTVQYKALKGTYSGSVSVNPSAGATTLIVADTTGLVAGQEYTLQDGSNKEDVIITSIDSGTVVTVPAITNSYTSAYLYDYYVGNPVGVVDYDFRADVLANKATEGEQWTKKTEMGVLPDSDGWTLGNNTGSASISSGILNIITTGTQQQSYNIEDGNISPSLTKRFDFRFKVNSNAGDSIHLGHIFKVKDGTREMRLVFTTTDIYYLNSGVTLTSAYTGNLQSNFVNIRIEFNDTFGVKVYVEDVLEVTVPYTSLYATTATPGIDFGDNENSSPAMNADTEWDYIRYQLDLASNPDQPTSTIPMDLITQSYTLTNASGATLEHFAKFGTGSYNLMTETSTDNFAYEHSTEEDNIKIKTTVVGDTSQLLDIQLELGGVSNV